MGDKTIRQANKAVKDNTSFFSYKGMDFNVMPFKNSQIEKAEGAYAKQQEKDEEVNLGENSMFTGNAWFDIGRSIALKRKSKGK